MDALSANQSRTPGHQWAGQNGWSAASPPGPLCDPLPSAQHLSLGSPSDQRPGHDHQNLRNQSLVFTDAAELSVQHVIPHVSHVDPASSHERNKPPCSLPLMNNGSQPPHPQGMSAYPPHCPYQAISAPFHPPYSHHVSLNGPQSLQQTHVSPPSFRQCAEQNPQCAQQKNVESPVRAGYIHTSAPPTSPIQQQPQWAPPSQCSGR